MHTEKHRGLSGKARRVHGRNRAARLQTKRLIQEYFAPEPGNALTDRYIPIRGRCEFFSSVASLSVQQGAKTGRLGGSAQLDLPLTTDDRARRREQSTGTRRVAPDHELAPRRDVAIRFLRGTGTISNPASKPAGMFERRPTFKLGGFLVGCALGGIAASLALLVLHTALS